MPSFPPAQVPNPPIKNQLTEAMAGISKALSTPLRPRAQLTGAIGRLRELADEAKRLSMAVDVRMTDQSADTIRGVVEGASARAERALTMLQLREARTEVGNSAAKANRAETRAEELAAKLGEDDRGVE